MRSRSLSEIYLMRLLCSTKSSNDIPRSPVRRVLELGSGTAPHLEEWKRRGVEYFGIDTSDIMLKYSRRKARDLRAAARFFKADMRKFSLGARVDFAYVMLGSLFVKSTSDIRSHFRSVAKALNSGGLLSRLVRELSVGRPGPFQSLDSQEQVSEGTNEISK